MYKVYGKRFSVTAPHTRQGLDEMPTLSEVGFHFVRGADCCHTSSSKRLRAFNSPNRSACEASCVSTPSCEFISMKDKLCVLCSSCNIRQNSGHFASWSRVALPKPVDTIGDLLQEQYSASLYGAPGRVDTASLRLLWLPLLPDAALRAIGRLGGLCKYDSGYPWRPLFTALDIFANPVDSVWISWEHKTHAGFPVANHSWIEVTHCGQGAHKVGQRNLGWQFGPMWLYAAPGSGVSINVGRSVVMSHSDAARLLRRVYPNALECACEPGCAFGLRPGSSYANSSNARTNGSSCISNLVPRSAESDVARRYTRCWTRDAVLAELDTIQIFDHVEYFSRERRHEIVRLRHDGECATLEPGTPHLRCGRFPHLRRCERNSTALQLVSHCVSSKQPLSATYTCSRTHGCGKKSALLNSTGQRCQMASTF